MVRSVPCLPARFAIFHPKQTPMGTWRLVSRFHCCSGYPNWCRHLEFIIRLLIGSSVNQNAWRIRHIISLVARLFMLELFDLFVPYTSEKSRVNDLNPETFTLLRKMSSSILSPVPSLYQLVWQTVCYNFSHTTIDTYLTIFTDLNPQFIDWFTISLLTLAQIYINLPLQ